MESHPTEKAAHLHHIRHTVCDVYENDKGLDGLEQHIALHDKLYRYCLDAHVDASTNLARCGGTGAFEDIANTWPGNGDKKQWIARRIEEMANALMGISPDHLRHLKHNIYSATMLTPLNRQSGVKMHREWFYKRIQELSAENGHDDPYAYAQKESHPKNIREVVARRIVSLVNVPYTHMRNLFPLVSFAFPNIDDDELASGIERVFDDNFMPKDRDMAQRDTVREIFMSPDQGPVLSEYLKTYLGIDVHEVSEK